MFLNLGPAWLSDIRCLRGQNINMYSNKPTNEDERIIRRFKEDLATLGSGKINQEKLENIFSDENVLINFR